MLCVAFPLLFLIFYLCLYFCQFYFSVSRCVLPWVHPAWDSLCFLDLDDYFLFHVREVFSYYLFKYFLGSLFSLSSPSGTPIMRMLVDLMFQRSLSLSSFFKNSFFYIMFCGSDSHYSVLLVTYPFFCLSYSAIHSF